MRILVAEDEMDLPVMERHLCQLIHNMGLAWCIVYLKTKSLRCLFRYAGTAINPFNVVSPVLFS